MIKFFMLGGLSIPSDIDKISPKTSACFICPEIDMEIKEKQRELIKSSLEKIRQSDPRFQYLVKYYDGVEHGFSVRGNENDPVIAAKRQDAHKTNANFLSNLG